MQSAKPKNEHSFPKRTPMPGGPGSSPEPTTYTSCRNGGSWDTSVWVLQPLQCLSGGLGHPAEVTKCLQVSARCQHLQQRKRQEPDTHPGTRYVFGHGSLDHCFWSNHVGLLIPIHLLAVLDTLVLCLERYLGDASFFPFSC